MRKEYQMSQEQFDKLMEMCSPTPAIMLQCGPGESVQERANRGWRELGAEMGFDWESALPIQGKDSTHFTAVPLNPEPLPDNVTPIRTSPDATAHGTYQLQGKPYTTPADAVRDVLSSGTFNQNAIAAAGPVEIRIVAEFSEKGALFYNVEMARAVRKTVEIPVDQEKCNHHWNTPTPGAMACSKCDLHMTAKEWGEKYARPPVLGADGKPIR